jgi:hypothetical protein
MSRLTLQYGWYQEYINILLMVTKFLIVDEFGGKIYEPLDGDKIT